ncbi:non-ribosomal peptide synthetase [Micromonospora echinofusca]|uniref:Amino acid adenylation domain-containing protein n=1 Tax=Micromonospora echinofusca TaxID=47858 RepID=A0ABS3VJZ6_MICEH|nr:non-ribosomal peptide synthetase [Micromonospora echinofusca]MBO4204848.1 amino acid adenylation domain-containing protein [Micromonospora echinofusca]
MSPTTDRDGGRPRATSSGSVGDAVADLSPQRQALLLRKLAERGLAGTAGTTAPAIARQPRTGPDQRFVCSSGQRRMWLSSQYDPTDPSFHVAVSLRFTGRLRVDALRHALSDLVQRHEVLRTVYVGEDGEPRQVVRATMVVPMTEVDLRDLPAADRETRARELGRAAFATPFDLATGPVLRAALYRLADDGHVLMVTVHHIAIDGWSIGNALRELAVCYSRRLDGTDPPPPLPELAVQYADYAHWQQQALAGDGELASGLDFWRRQLAAPRTDTELPTTRRRAGTVDGGGNGGKVIVMLPPDLLDGLRRAAGTTRGTTPFVLLLTAFKALLMRYTATPDVTVGTLVAARTQVELEPLVGYFANPLALRTRLDPGWTFTEAVARVRSTVIDGFAHQGVPFDLVVQELAPRRDADRHPFFQSAMIMHNFDNGGGGSGWPGLDVRWWDGALDDMLFDLTLVGVPQPDGAVEVTFSYRTEVFDHADVERLAGHFLQLLTALRTDPGRCLGDLPLLTPAERQRMLTDWQGPVRAGTTTFPALWRQSVRRHPDAVAVSAADGDLSYRELDLRADRLAQRLRATGVRPEDPVGICLDRSSALLVAVLGVWRAGAAYVPLDPSFPVERLRMMVADAGVAVLVTETPVHDRLAGLCAAVPEVIYLDRERTDPTTPTVPPTVTGPHADQLAYVIYTSGSTGRPKGVEVSHGAVGNLLCSFAGSLGLTPADRLLAVTTLSFDISVLELLLPLVTGARTVIADNVEVTDGVALRTRARASGATVMQATPATWRMLLSAGGVPDPVRHRLCGGEAFSRDLTAALAGGTLWNVYGPTETTVWSAAGVVEPSDGPVSIGPPIGNTHIHLLDDRGQPVPVGVTGEVFIGGAGVARGYRGRAALTADRFVPDPFTDTPGARMYATGDLARRLPDGRLEFLGRGDQQVKVRGFRVELGEIEAVLRTHDDLVWDAAVAAWTGGAADSDGDTRLVAYLVAGLPDTGPAELWALLAPRLAQRLPGYLMPATVVLLDALPLTPNGKLDRAALPAPDWGATSSTPYVAPRNPVETAVARIWEEVLDVRPIGVDSDFFALGGHSLLAERVLARLRAYFQLAAPTRVLFEAPTVAGLSAALAEREPVPGQLVAIAELRAQIEAMSPEAVARMLDEEEAVG